MLRYKKSEAKEIVSVQPPGKNYSKINGHHVSNNMCKNKLQIKLQSKLFATAIFCLAYLGVVSGFETFPNALGSDATAPGTTAASATKSSGVPDGDSNIFVNLAKKLVPSVVNISTFTTVKGSGMPAPGMPGIPGFTDDIFKRFFEDYLRKQQRRNDGGGNDGDDEDDDSNNGSTPLHPPRGPRAMSLGSGFIIDSSGLILTNNHVVGDADEIKIFFTESPDEKPTDGEVVGRDAELDVAVIKVKTKREMVPVVLGDSDHLEVGEYVLAIGNPFGQGHSVTHGIISAKGRLAPDFPLANYLQTDTPINPGNSGGPLVNLKGEVIGINNAIEQRAQGIGFAIPISLVKKILPQLRSKGSVARGYIGVLVNELTPDIASKLGATKDLHAPFVTYVYPGQPADLAGIKPYDVIVEFNGKPIHAPDELISTVVAVSVNQTVPVKIIREGHEKTLQIKVSLRPGTKGGIENSKHDKKKGKKQSHIETGMSLENLTQEIARDLGISTATKGVVVSSVSFGSAADKAGLTRGDLILEVDRKTVKDVDSFYGIVNEKKSYLLRVRRSDPQGQEVFSVIILDLKE